ncbi:MAG: ArnT family glycosyltransferase [Vicinamibacterales bacterium]
MSRWGFAVLAALSGVWAATVWLGGGVDLVIAGVRVVSRSPARPALIGLGAAACHILINGWARARTDLAASARMMTLARVAGALAVGTIAVALTFNTWAAGGADSYAYVTQADLWLQGNLKVPIPLAERAPWPNALATFTPFGYRSTPEATAIVPVTAPGLPLLMAVAKWLGGHAAMFWVVPLCGGLLVWSTFAIGREMGSEAAGLAAAWLVATSPTFLSMTKSVMSDVPAAAFWALATMLALRKTRSAGVLSGSCAGVALVIRPNLALLGIVLGVWVCWDTWRTDRANWLRPFLTVAGMVPAAMVVALVNTWLYGAPVASGYGDVGSLFAAAHIPINLRRYTEWLLQTQTWMIPMGLIAVLLPLRFVWGDDVRDRAPALLAAVALATWASYLAYSAFDAWWFLRFLLPAWPAIFLGLTRMIERITGRERAWGRVLLATTSLLLGAMCAETAVRLGVYPEGEGERRYATIAELVAKETESGSVILAGQHVGAVRYYGGRQSLQFSELDPAWLDRAVEWLAREGRKPYFLLEDWEIPVFTARFAGQRAGLATTFSPVLAYEADRIHGTIYLFDPDRPTGPIRRPLPIRNPQPLSPRPAAVAVE